MQLPHGIYAFGDFCTAALVYATGINPYPVNAPDLFIETTNIDTEALDLLVALAVLFPSL